jgi:Skp family chaperone for outer membrane proteins
MKTLLISAAAAAAFVASSAANAQSVPAATVAVVDLDRVTSQCNACKTAIAALNSQATAESNREKALVTPLQTEQKAIQDAIDALGGKPADAALKARATAFQTKYEQAQQQAARGRQQLEANQAYVRKQILDKLNGVYQGVMQRRGANLLVEQGATLASTTSVDVTNDVLAALNAALPTVSTTAPASAAPAAKQQPQGR